VSAEAVAVQLASELLPELVKLIAEGIEAGLSPEAAKLRALEMMRSKPVPPAVTDEIALLFARARERQPP
jgi:hypothetical protein